MTIQKRWILGFLIVVFVFLCSSSFELMAFNTDDLNQLLKSHRCPGGDLSNADLGGENLVNADLRNANLRGVNLDNANLKGADLTGANLQNASLCNANLKEAYLQSANLQNANLTGANLKSSFIMGASLINANLQNTNLRYADLSGANLSGTNLVGANLKDAILPVVTPSPVPTATPVITLTPTPSKMPTPGRTPTPLSTSPIGRTPTPMPPVTPGTTTPGITPTPLDTIAPTEPPVETATPVPTPAPTETPATTPMYTPGPGQPESMIGLVKDAVTGEKIFNPIIDVYNGSNFSNFLTTTVGYKGLYYLWLEPGFYKVVVRADNYLPITSYISLVGGATIYESVLAAVPNTCQGVGTVNGTVINITNSQPMAGLNIAFREGTNALQGPVVTTATTGMDGTYAVQLPAGNYTGEVSDQGLALQSFTVTSIGGSATAAPLVRVTPNTPEEPIRIILSWSSGMNLDAHLAGADLNSQPFHVWNQAWVAGNERLDFDATWGNYGVEIITINHLAQLKGCVYSVYDMTHQWGTLSTALSESWAKVQVYRGANLVNTFNVPTGKTGTLWTVFTMDETGIRPVNETSTETDPSSIGLDFNGDGMPDWMVTGALYPFTIEHYDGTTSSYALPTSDWKVIRYGDTDGLVGNEIIVDSDDPSTDGPGRWLFVISDRTANVRRYTDFTGYTLLALADLDGVVGQEMILDKRINGSPINHTIRIVNDHTGVCSDYNGFFSAGPDFGVASAGQHDLNGSPGNELVLTRSQTGGVFELATLSYFDGKINYYTTDPGTWELTIRGDTDGQPGYEIQLESMEPYISGAGKQIWLVHDNNQTITKFTGLTGFYLTSSLADLDGNPGNEMVFQNYSSGVGQNTVKILCDATQSSCDYTFTNQNGTYPYLVNNFALVDLNGRTGNEVILDTYNSDGSTGIAILDFRNNHVNYYTVEPGWYFYNVFDYDGQPGNELIFTDGMYSFKAICDARGIIIE